MYLTAIVDEVIGEAKFHGRYSLFFSHLDLNHSWFKTLKIENGNMIVEVCAVADEFAVENSKRVIGELTQRMKKKVAPGKVNKNRRGE